tara:strand:- start:3208 stop:3411 length:204 start_codon:yes stop_codon:yes gene_type:complete
MANWKDEMLEDKSTPLWVLDFAQQIEKLDVVDALNGVEVLQSALQKRFKRMTTGGSIREYITGEYAE